MFKAYIIFVVLMLGALVYQLIQSRRALALALI
jgi:hypothetical protein